MQNRLDRWVWNRLIVARFPNPFFISHSSFLISHFNFFNLGPAQRLRASSPREIPELRHSSSWGVGHLDTSIACQQRMKEILNLGWLGYPEQLARESHAEVASKLGRMGNILGIRFSSFKIGPIVVRSTKQPPR